MFTEDLLIKIPHGWIAFILFLLLLAATEVGMVWGKRLQRRMDDATRSQLGALEGAMLGVLGLLLAFTFGMAGTRNEARRAAMVHEANAIGTAYLRTDILGEPHTSSLRNAMRDYTDIRLDLGGAKLDVERIKRDRARISELQNQMWKEVMAATSKTVTPTSGLVIGSFNEMFDAQASADMATLARVPTIIFLLLSAVACIAMGTVGCACAMGVHRNFMGTAMLALLITTIVFVIFDLDRPQRGLIKVNELPMQETRRAMN